MRKLFMLLAMAIFLVVGGCATGKHWVTPATTYTTKNCVVVEADKAEVWKRLVRSISQSFFVINNLDKDSGLINVSYSGKAAPYIDCGYFNIEVTGPRGKQEYSFPYNSPYEKYVVCRDISGPMGPVPQLCPTNRKTDLQGRINVLVEEMDTRTRVSVHVKYIFNIQVQTTWYQSIGFSGIYRTETLPSHTENFITGSRGDQCVSTGVLEKTILSFVE